MPSPRTLTPPKRLRIGHRFYAVKYVDAIEADDGSACNGLCVFDRSEILILQSLTPDVMAEIVLHEVLHAVHWEAGLTDDSDEEAFTNLTAKALCRFYQDNPTATRWLMRSLQPPKDR